MGDFIVKGVKTIDNTQWKERHQFILSANGNIICQRYFRVNGFNGNALQSEELYHTFMDAVRLIKEDLKAKSRIYMAIVMSDKSKLTGFYHGEPLNYADACLAYSNKGEGVVELSNGVKLDKSYIYHENLEDDDNNQPFVFNFSYLFDGKVIYETEFDGNVYPKYVRNSVDLSNSDASYRNSDQTNLTFSQQMTKSLTTGREDLIYRIINMLCDTLSNNIDEDGGQVEKDYTTYTRYGDKNYYYTAYPKEYVKGWMNAVKNKTNEYFKPSK